MTRTAEELTAAIDAEIAWHQSEARKHRDAAQDLELADGAEDEFWQNNHDAAMHEDAAVRLQAILYPPAPPEEEIAF